MATFSLFDFALLMAKLLVKPVKLFVKRKQDRLIG